MLSDPRFQKKVDLSPRYGLAFLVQGPAGLSEAMALGRMRPTDLLFLILLLRLPAEKL
jgi:hypothetical protein